MYSKQETFDICVGVDRGILRLQFSRKLSRQLYGKKQVYKALGRPDTPENKRWAEDIARRIQKDIDHPDSLFDPTLEKYLGVKINSNIVQLPGAKPELKLGELWLEFAEYKLKTGQIHETTYLTRYKRTFLNWLKPYLDEPLSRELAETIIFEVSKNANKDNLKKMIGALSEACERAIHNGNLSKNYFWGLQDTIKSPRRSQQLTEEEDYRAFSREERDIIINTLRTSDKKSEKTIADLVEFLFLTGCRLGEAFALKWNDIKLDKGWIVFDESYSTETKITKCTKTNTIRIFRIKNYTRLLDLINRMKTRIHSQVDYVFISPNGEKYNRFKLNQAWNGIDKSKNGVPYYYPGVVTRLVKERKVSQYLKPSATRHTFITIQAHNGTDLKLLADSVGNSVDIIYNHYLGVNKDAVMADL